MAKAVRDGLNEVVLSISTAQSADEINKLNDNQLQHFVSGIMVLMENRRMSAILQICASA